jgi:hypothetical protein
MQTIGRLGSVALGSLVLCVSLAGCNKKNPEACSNAQSTIRTALTNEDFASARQWRDYAYKQCDDKSALDALDKEIVDKEAEVKKRKADEEALKTRTDQLMKLFTDWASQFKSNPAGAAVTVSCTESPDPKDPKKEKDRWCTRERTAGEFKLYVRYWDATPDVYEFSTTAPGTVSCDAFGSATVIKNAHQGALYQCELSGTLAGAQALTVHTAQGTLVSIYSPKLLEMDPVFKKRTEM